MDELDKKRIGERIKTIRKSRGENQTDFAKIINATLPAVSNWETGRNIPNNERLKAIADLGGISVNELIYGDLKQYIYSVLHEELLEVDELYHKIIEYIQLNDNDINEIDDENVQNDILQVSSESFLKDHFNSIYDYVSQNFPLKDIDGIYDSKDLFIERAISYVDNLIYNKKNNIIIGNNFRLSYLKKITLDKIEEFENETRYIFNCRISLETTDDLGNREYVELNYITDAIVNIYISEDNDNHQYIFSGLYAFNDKHYHYILGEKTFIEVKKYIVNEALKHEKIKKYNLIIDNLEELKL